MSTVELFADDRATHYDDFVTQWISGYDYFMEILPKILKDNHNSTILVAGCGTGNEILMLLEANQNWNITGVDPSPDMIVQAQQKLANHPLVKQQNVTLIEGVVADLDINQKYDVATLLLVLHFFADDGSKLQLLQDISDRLKVGASFVLFDITGSREHMQNNLAILKNLLPEHIDPAEVDMRLDRMANTLCPVSEERVTELFEQAGFTKPTRFFQSSIYMGWIAQKK